MEQKDITRKENEEIKKIVRKLKLGKTPGVDRIRAEMWIYLLPNLFVKAHWVHKDP